MNPARLLDDGSVVVPPGVARRLFWPLQRALADARRNGERLLPGVAEVVRLFGKAGQAAARVEEAPFARESKPQGVADEGASSADGPLSSAAVAGRLGISRTRVCQLAGSGTLCGTKPGRDWVFAAVDVDAFERGRAV